MKPVRRRAPLARLLLRTRTSLGLTLREMAERTGLSNPYLSQLETGTIVNPTIFALAKVARGYRLHIHRLVDEALKG